jgi:hypothetical protein
LEAGARIKAAIPGLDARWRCLAAIGSTVERVIFTGSEGTH